MQPKAKQASYARIEKKVGAWVAQQNEKKKFFF